MSNRIHELLNRNLQEVFGEGDAVRRRAATNSVHMVAMSTIRVCAAGKGTNFWLPHTHQRHSDPTSTEMYMFTR